MTTRAHRQAMDIAVTAAVLVGTVLLLGSGIARRWFAASVGEREQALLTSSALLGAALLVAGSLGDVTSVVTRVLRGGFDLDLFLEYLASTRHGQAAVLRTVAAIPLALWAARPAGHGRAERVAFGVAGVALLATISLVSHSGTMGAAGLVADLAHLVATVSWAGALAGLAVLPVWSPGQRLRTYVRGVSRLGLAAVIVLVTTGTYMATLHMYGFEAITASAYGRALTVKLLLVAIVLALAAANRWLFVPLLERFDRSLPLRRSVRVEIALLALVLVATAVVATREPAHGPPADDSAPVHTDRATHDEQPSHSPADPAHNDR